MIVTLSHAGTATFAAESTPERVLVGTVDGVAVLRQSDRGWDLEDRHLKGAHVHALTVVGELVFAGLSNSGLQVSADLGTTWQSVGLDLADANVYSIAVTPGDSPLLYVGTEPARLFVSHDLGTTFEELLALRDVPHVERWWFPAPPHDAHTKHIAIDPNDPQVIYACVEQGALLRSSDGGRGWSRLEGTDDDAHRVVIDPTNPRHLYATSGAGAFTSFDAGATWTCLTGADNAVGHYPDQLVVRPSQPDVIFMTAAQDHPGTWWERTAASRVWRSVDGGKAWTHLQGGLPDPLRSSVEAMSLVDIPGQPASVFIATTGGEVWEGQGDGDRWHLATADLPPISKGGHHFQFEHSTAITTPAQ